MKTLFLLLLTLLTLPAVRGQGYSWSTFAGKTGASGSADGVGGDARFTRPSGVAVDREGNLYVADIDNHTIRKITPGGVVSTPVGKGNFILPRGIAVDGGGTVYVADSGNHIIRKITLEGVVSTLAGKAGAYGRADGAGAEARFSEPRGVAVDGDGNVYVGDSGNHTIRKITPEGVVSTLAGSAVAPGSADGAGGEARFGFPSAVAVDGGGTVYVADSSNHTVRKITPEGVVSTLAGKAEVPGGSADGAGAEARFLRLYGLAVDGGGTVYVADYDNHTIRKITPEGVVSTIGGTAGVSGGRDGLAGAARFNYPYGIAVDANGSIYVGDRWNNTIRKGTPEGALSGMELWRQNHFGSPNNTGAGADGSDPDGDGMTNLMEFALGLDPQVPSVPPYSLIPVQDGIGGNSSLLFSYRRSAAAVDAGAVFTVEWSDDLAGPWSAQAVTERVFSAVESFENMRAVLSRGAAGRRFVRLKVSAP